jgi:large conductance mechanosensitive channel
MGMISEFKEFAMKGNVVDLAVGVVIGAAFGKIVTAVVDNILMPIVGLMTGGVDFSKWTIILKDAVIESGKETTPALTLGVGAAINAIVQFIIVAFFLFMVIKAMNAAKKKEVAAPAAPPEDVALLTEIRDLLKK